MQRRIFAAGALRLKIQFPTARSKPSRSSGCRRVVSQCPGRHQAKVGAGPRSPREGMREGDNSLQLLHGQLHRWQGQTLFAYGRCYNMMPPATNCTLGGLGWASLLWEVGGAASGWGLREAEGVGFEIWAKPWLSWSGVGDVLTLSRRLNQRPSVVPPNQLFSDSSPWDTEHSDVSMARRELRSFAHSYLWPRCKKQKWDPCVLFSDKLLRFYAWFSKQLRQGSTFWLPTRSSLQ